MSNEHPLVTPDLKQRIMSLYSNMARRLKIKQCPKIVVASNKKNSDDPFGKTAYYDPIQQVVKIYITNRHPTDILRSFAHEIIHHWQNENGKLPLDQKQTVNYAQTNPVLRKCEMEAYLLGNIIFRDWQDENRSEKLNENLAISKSNHMKVKIKQMLFDLIKDRILISYHREKISGDMNPTDFVEELARDIELKINEFIQTVNNRGNWENQPNMIKEMTKKELKALIHNRIQLKIK